MRNPSNATKLFMNRYACPCGKSFERIVSLGVHAHFCKICTTEVRFWAKVEKGAGCWLWTGAKNDDGYGHFNLKGRTTNCHKWVYEQAFGKVPKGQTVMHSCDTPACVRLEHLKLGTHQENMADCKAKKRYTYGERGRDAKLTEADVRKIRAAYWCKSNTRGKGRSNLDELHKLYPHVSRGTLYSAASGRSWRHL